jgi:hypothetical protein
VELTCDLAPLGYVALCEALTSQDSWRKATNERLEEYGGIEVLRELQAGYQALWDLQLKQSAGDVTQLWPVGVNHATLATWILAGLRRLRRPSEELSAHMRSIVDREVLKCFGDIRYPDMLRPIVLAWTLGQVRGRLDARIPAVPAIAPFDPDVALAYSGLVTHLLNLQEVGQPWPEVAGSANIWRTAGIIDGIKTHPKANLMAAITEAMNQLGDVTTEAFRRELEQQWGDFRDARNALTHISGHKVGYRFHEVIERSVRWDEFQLAVRGVTYFLFSDISFRLIEEKQLIDPGCLLNEVLDEINDWRRAS